MKLLLSIITSEITRYTELKPDPYQPLKTHYAFSYVLKILVLTLPKGTMT